MDKTEPIWGNELTQTGWSGEEMEVQEDFIWGIGQEALYQMTRGEYKTKPDKIAINDLLRLLNDVFYQKMYFITEVISSGENKPRRKISGGD